MPCNNNNTQSLDHKYAKSVNDHITIDQQYADDIGWASTDISEIENIEKTVPPVFKERNLFVNESKTERFEVIGNDITGMELM